MPELPEVETIARQLRARGVEGRTILSVKVNWAPTVEPYSVAAFSKATKGATIDRISRVGKWMMFSLGSGQTIMIHLRMSGSFSMEKGSHDRIVMKLSDGLTLYYRDTRKFGRWKLVDDPDVILRGLGPDALTRGFTRSYFSAAIATRRRAIKAVILDQSIVAGLGNIYADEALWASRIHPERAADSLSDAELEALFKAIKQVLKIGVKNRGTSLGAGKTNYRDVDGASGGHREEVKAYGKSGRPCARCENTLEKSWWRNAAPRSVRCASPFDPIIERFYENIKKACIFLFTNRTLMVLFVPLSGKQPTNQGEIHYGKSGSIRV